VDELILILIIMAVAGLLERVLKAAQRGGGTQAPEAEPGAGADLQAPGLPDDLKDLIAEELGINLERRPRVEEKEDIAVAEDLRPEPTVAHPQRRPRPVPEPVEVTPAGPVISLEEQGMLERGEAVSLETQRTPAQHERFHRLYVGTSEELSVTRRRGARLPERASWSPLRKAVIWSEIFGPPKGLTQ